MGHKGQGRKVLVGISFYEASKTKKIYGPDPWGTPGKTKRRSHQKLNKKRKEKKGEWGTKRVKRLLQEKK